MIFILRSHMQSLTACVSHPLTIHHIPLFYLPVLREASVFHSILKRHIGSGEKLRDTSSGKMNWTKKGRGLKYMHDFSPLCEIVTVGYRLNDGTHVHANSPLADRKLSWTAAILFRHALRRRGLRRLIGRMMAERARGVLQAGWDS